MIHLSSEIIERGSINGGKRADYSSLLLYFIILQPFLTYINQPTVLLVSKSTCDKISGKMEGNTRIVVEVMHDIWREYAILITRDCFLWLHYTSEFSIKFGFEINNKTI
jgi:hypothetical protein